jgi:hypothetical protein
MRVSEYYILYLHKVMYTRRDNMLGISFTIIQEGTENMNKEGCKTRWFTVIMVMVKNWCRGFMGPISVDFYILINFLVLYVMSTCSPRYSGGIDQEDEVSRPV